MVEYTELVSTIPLPITSIHRRPPALSLVFVQPGSVTAEKNTAARESGALRIENEDLKDKLEEAGRKLDEVQNKVFVVH